jgi:hypothetical protein
MPVGSRFSNLGAQASELLVAAADRLEDARALFAAGRFASAIAMATYSLEINIKVLICKRLNVVALPRAFEIHELDGLLLLAGFHTALQSAPLPVQKNWNDIMTESSSINDLRYKPSSNWSQSQAHIFLQQLCDPPDGVLPWLLALP